MPHPVDRRRFLASTVRIGAAALLTGCQVSTVSTRPPPLSTRPDSTYDYIVIGAGAGGAPLAANLAKLGHTVLVLESGGDDSGPADQVPLFHPQASEAPQLRWDFFVRHYADDHISRRDPKFRPEHGGVLYPRCSTLGGCTVHNALILLAPHPTDWERIAALTGDSSWRYTEMRAYFQRLERCGYVSPVPGNPSGHGFTGWLPVNLPGRALMHKLLFNLIVDTQLRDGIFLPAYRTLYPGGKLARLKSLLTDISQQWQLDPNDRRFLEAHREGLVLLPMTTAAGRRAGPREYLLEVARAHPERLTILTHRLVHRVLLDDARRAVGVEAWRGRHLYRAERDPSPAKEPEAVETFRARREIILAGGAFNTPQILMLSGIGPAEALRRHGIPVRVALPGVGRNLQDRYEISVVTEMRRDFTLLRDARFRPGDPPYRQWQRGRGLYTTNGVLLSFSRRSRPQLTEPDLFVFGMPGNFRGYYPGYAKDAVARKDLFSWIVLKAHTRNDAGTVRLHSADPRQPPQIDFHYFDEASDPDGEDLEAVIDGLEFVRTIVRAGRPHVHRELIPGPEIQGREALAAFVRANAWGHHAACSCRMGRNDDPLAVVDSRFRVRGVGNLRIVDASVFPHIPGFFIVSAVYMLAEKATDMIHADAVAGSPTGGESS